MKKILTVSLLAMMAANAANANIASVEYVNRVSGEAQTAAESTAATALTAAKTELNAAIALKADETALDTLSTTVTGIDTAYKAADTALSSRIDGLTGTGDQAAVTNETFDEFKTENAAAITKAQSDAIAAAKTETTTQIGALDLAAVSATGKAIVSVSQTDGKLAAAPGEIGTAGIADLAVTTAKIADGNVTKAKLDSNVQASLGLADSAFQVSDMKKSDRADAGADNDVFPSVAYMIDTISNTQSEIAAANDRIDALDLTAVSATGKAIVSVSQTDGKLAAAPGEIGTAGIADLAVTTAKIADGNVTKAKLDSNVQASLGLADSALQKADITEGKTNGTISVDGTDVNVNGLGTAAYTASTAYDAAGTAQAKVDALASGQVATNTSNIGTINTNLGPLAGVKIPAACTTDAVCSLVMNKGTVAWEVITY